MRAHVVYLGAVLAAGLAGTLWAGEVVRTPRLVSEHVVDCSTVESIIAAIIKPDMTPRAKAEAVYEFVRTHRFHWLPAREGARRDDFEYGIVYDPIKLLNVYGYGYCFQCAPLLESLYEAAGLEARVCGIGGHSICEVFYDGGYHFYDADQHGFFRLLDGKTVASMDQLSRDPMRLVLNQPNPSEPFFPAVRNPRGPYESKVLVAAYFASRDNNYTRHDKFYRGHRMDVTLAPGMRYLRYFEPRGQWSYNWQDLESDVKNGYLDVAAGPTDPFSDKTYGSGALLWQPDLTGATNEYRAGVWQDENMSQDERGLLPAEAGKPARAVFRVRLPYAIVGWPGAWTGPPKPVGAAVVSASFDQASPGDAQAISVSTDGGRTWRTVWQNDRTGPSRAVVDVSEWVSPGYEYMVRFELQAKTRPGDCRLEQLALHTSFQLNPATLPAVRTGRTRMTFTLGEQTETFEQTADLSSREAFLRDVHEVRNVWFERNRLTGKFGRQGEIIYRLEPPRPGVIRALSVVAGCRREPVALNAADDVRVFYAENEAKNWKLLVDDDVPPYMEHWSYFLSGQARCGPNVKRVFVKLSIRTAANASIQMIGLRGHWQPAEDQDQPRQAGVRGVRVEHGWTEGGVEKRFETVIKDVPTEYTIEAGQAVVNRWVSIEPVRDGKCRWRPDDPPVHRPRLPAPRLVDPATRDEMQSLVKAIDADPQANLPKAAASKIEWLADGARQGLAMFRAKYPLVDGPTFEQAVLREAGRLMVSQAGVAAAAPASDSDEPARASGPTTAPAVSADNLLAALQSVGDDRARAWLAAAMVVLNDARGQEPLARAVKSVPPGLVLEPAVVLLRSGDKAGRQAARAILADPDTFLKLRFLELVSAAKVRPMPDELLGGLTDSSRWVRLAALGICRGATGEPVRRAVVRMSREDPLPWLRDEALSVLETLR